jgi:two-component system copper resistance phosphate regulon response regulator CusR
MRILVVEDEKRIADFLCRGLQGAGYAVDAAPTGAAALDCTHSTDYDLVVLDLMLPDMDGLQVLAKIRNRKVGPPVLILSARGGLDDRVKGLEQGADDYEGPGTDLRRPRKPHLDALQVGAGHARPRVWHARPRVTGASG